MTFNQPIQRFNDVLASPTQSNHPPRRQLHVSKSEYIRPTSSNTAPEPLCNERSGIKAIGRLGGTVGVEFTPGAGSTFWFELPGVTAIAANSLSESQPTLEVK